MIKTNAAILLKDIQNAQRSDLKVKAIKHPRRFIKIAREQGYNFSPENLALEIENLSYDELAALMNPGVGPRQHLIAR